MSARNFPRRKSLIGGEPCWTDPPEDVTASDPLPASADIVIIGAGVMGAMLAETLTAAGRQVAILDRRTPVTGSTAASTALVMWAADVPLSHLEERYGAEGAAARWRRVHQAVTTLADRIGTLDIDCGWKARPDIYLAGNVLDDAGLRTEAAARKRARLPSEHMTADEVSSRFGFPARSALVSSDSFEVDPVALSLGLIGLSRARGATVTYRTDIARIAARGDGVRLTTTGGDRIDAGHVILAAGYEAARWSVPKGFALGSSYAIATKPGTAPAWRENALIWEASDPYLYARATADGRIIVGGEDEDIVRPALRDRMIPAKRAALEKKASALLDRKIVADCSWGATFGRSPDGLPAFGALPGLGGTWLACGFGGNGISFAALAAEFLGKAICGAPDPDAALFSPDRFR